MVFPRENGVLHLADALGDLHPSTAAVSLVGTLIIIGRLVVEVVILFVLFKRFFFKSLIDALMLKDDAGKTMAWKCTLHEAPELLKHGW